MADAVRYAFVTLLTSDFYLPGALALAAALRDIHPSPPVDPEVAFETVCVVTPETLDVSTIKLLRKAYDLVVGVEVITQEDDKGLQLLGRPDLYTVLTKLHVFRLTQYSKIIFLDADILPIRPLSHLFTLPHTFSAVPDVGWPDAFNSGVMVLSPSEGSFRELNSLLTSRGSWDGGDQGLLNEWRGNDWNRLSFTYNTTPTAAYTYAPAYERFGSQIKVIHFIGPNKPWNSIAYRAPFSGQSTPAESTPVYDYNSLLDRWFAVYDKHYRVQSIMSQTDFAVHKYNAAWDEQGGTGAEVVSAAGQSGAGTGLGLEDLRLLAVEGMNSLRLSSGEQTGEGMYASLPLEGRVHLMRLPANAPADVTPGPQTISFGQSGDFKAEGVSADLDSTPVARRHTLRTPGPDELPPSPLPQAVPLPPVTASTHVAEPQYAYDGAAVQPDSIQQHQPSAPAIQDSIYAQQSRSSIQQTYDAPLRQLHQEQPIHEHQQPQRPPSPPEISWNPAVEPPPHNVPTPNAFPADTYFPNIWDQAPSRRHDQPYQSRDQGPTSPAPDSGAFFQPPTVPDIPEQLRKQGHYRNVTGDGQAGSSPSPDREKVKPIFPWEEQQRPRPGRVFPASDAPPPSRFLYREPEPVPPLQSPSPPRSQPLSPLHGLPLSLTYANAWDTVPSIKKYANRLVRPPQPPPLAPAFDSKEWRRRGSRSWDERTEASSRDGDDEDNADDEDDEQHRPVRWNDDSENEAPTARTGRSRDSSVSSSYLVAGRKKEYRVRGVQTISPVMRSQGVQVGNGTQPTRSQKPSSTGPLPPISISQVSGGADVSMTTAFPSPAGGLRSPREFVFPDTPATARQTATTSTPPKRTSREDIESPSVTRQSSNDGSSLASPPSSVGPLSPPEGQPISDAPPRKPAGRVFDPARGVELFKRGSEEVLARFLKMSSWEEESAAR